MKKEVDIFANVSVKDFIKTVTSDDKHSSAIINDAKNTHVILNISAIGSESSAIQINLSHCNKNASLQALIRHKYQPISLGEVLTLGFKIDVLVVAASTNVQTSNQLDTSDQQVIDVNPEALRPGHGTIPLPKSQRKAFTVAEESITKNYSSLFSLDKVTIIEDHFQSPPSSPTDEETSSDSDDDSDQADEARFDALFANRFANS